MDFWNGRDFSNWNGNSKNAGGNSEGGFGKNNGGYGGNAGEGSSGGFNNNSGTGGFGGFGNNVGAGGNGGFGNAGAGNNGGKGQEFGADNKSYCKDKFDEYQNKSEDELTSELLKTAAEMKKAGKLNVSELEDFCNRASAFLSPDQLSKMRSLIGMLK